MVSIGGGGLEKNGSYSHHGIIHRPLSHNAKYEDPPDPEARK